ncbi:MFS transporter [Alkanindiges sp. WGS2144]|uniref:MFS transporter n=1 Tax=Alkanindiges sp. WGS2144 TaxID=3366808 RepID=UPI0037539D8D
MQHEAQRMIAWQQYSKKLPIFQFILLNIALGAGHFMAVLSAGAFLPMLPYVAGTIGQSLPLAVWGQSNYLAAMGLAFLIARPLMKRFGARNTAITAYLLFALSCCDVLLSTPNYSAFVLARTLQGFAAGLSISPSLFLLLDHYKPLKHKFAIALWSLAAFTPFSIGPALGGFFADIVDEWRLLFVVFLLLSLIITAIIWLLTDDSVNQQDKQYPVYKHLFIFACFATAVLALQGFFNLGIITLFNSREYEAWLLIAGMLLSGWLFWSCNRLGNRPLLDFSLFKYKNYTYGLILTCLAFMCVQGSIVQYIIRMQTIDGFSAWHVGLLFLPIFVLSKPLSIVTQHFVHRGYDPRLLACLSFIGFALSFWWIGSYSRPASWQSLLWPQFLEGAALGIFFIAMNHVTLSNVPEKEQLHAVDMLNAFRTISAALAIALTDIAWDRYALYVRHQLIAADSGNMSCFNDYATQADPAFMQQLWHQVNLHSGWITFNSTFQLLAIAFVIFAVLVWFASASHIVHTDKKQDLIVESLGEEP